MNYFKVQTKKGPQWAFVSKTVIDKFLQMFQPLEEMELRGNSRFGPSAGSVMIKPDPVKIYSITDLVEFGYKCTPAVSADKVINPQTLKKAQATVMVRQVEEIK